MHIIDALQNVLFVFSKKRFLSQSFFFELLFFILMYGDLFIPLLLMVQRT
uniref:Uncharacterized protein n=1 Tax=Utricularia reniformis TaxID=192314 RepID=A0A1Y0B4L3_9LAMI|nr:hypothetical protein AEK19_MT2215 [Utricularia reniformis]ART32361.1 hypothetical protein AEK19_MT2215 [Utricularia reniformis]